MAKGPERLLKWMLDPSFDLDHPVQIDIAWAADEIESLRAQVADFQQANHELDAEVERLKGITEDAYFEGGEDRIDSGDLLNLKDWEFSRSRKALEGEP